MLANYMQKENEVLELLRYFKASEFFYYWNDRGTRN